MSNDNWNGSVAMHKALKALATSTRPISASRVKTAAATALDNVKVIDPPNNNYAEIKESALRLSVGGPGGNCARGSRRRASCLDARPLGRWSAWEVLFGQKDNIARTVFVSYTGASILGVPGVSYQHRSREMDAREAETAPRISCVPSFFFSRSFCNFHCCGACLLLGVALKVPKADGRKGDCDQVCCWGCRAQPPVALALRPKKTKFSWYQVSTCTCTWSASVWGGYHSLSVAVISRLLLWFKILP